MCALFLTIPCVLWSANTLPPPVENVREANARAAAAIVTAKVTYEFELTRGALSDAELKRIKMPEPRQERNRAVMQDYEANVRKAVQLNRNRHELHTVWFDAVQMQWKVDQQDLRPINDLMTREGIDGSALPSVSQTKTLLSSRQARCMFHPVVGQLTILDAVKLPPPLDTMECVHMAPLKPGIVPDYRFATCSGAKVVAVSAAGRDLESVELEFPAMRVVIEADPAIGYHYRKLEEYTTDGKLITQALASDYRFTNGIFFPFRHEESKWNPDGALSRREVLVVKSAEFNKEIAASDLAVRMPAQSIVYDATRRKVLRSSTERTVSLQNLARLPADIEADAKRVAQTATATATE